MNFKATAIRDILYRFPSAGFTVAPTPIYRLARLSSLLESEIYVMRDDLTGFGIGGNKIRKLDYLVGAAKANGTQALVTLTANNFTRNLAIASKSHGIESHIILPGEASSQNPFSHSLFLQAASHLHFVPNGDREALEEKCTCVAGGLHDQGFEVQLLPSGGSTSVGALGYINAFDQIASFTLESGTHFNTIIHATGSAGTQAGLTLGRHISGYESDIIGMATALSSPQQTERVRQLTLLTAELVGVSADDVEIEVEDGFIGDGYEIPSEEGEEAIRLFANLEGILLDHVYTGKAAAGLVDFARRGRLPKGGNTLFIHTGGNAGQYY